MDEISKAMEISVEELCKRVEELTRLHWFSLDHVYSFVLFFFFWLLCCTWTNHVLSVWRDIQGRTVSCKESRGVCTTFF
jgi:hypothetical protein